MLTDKFSFSSGVNYNSHEGVVCNNMYSQSEVQITKNMQDVI